MIHHINILLLFLGLLSHVRISYSMSRHLYPCFPLYMYLPSQMGCNPPPSYLHETRFTPCIVKNARIVAPRYIPRHFRKIDTLSYYRRIAILVLILGLVTTSNPSMARKSSFCVQGVHRDTNHDTNLQKASCLTLDDQESSRKYFQALGGKLLLFEGRYRVMHEKTKRGKHRAPLTTIAQR